MALTLTGDGSITGLAAGGLPDLSIGTGDIADAAITAAKMSGAQSGSAPIYGARAWVNFNGTSTVAIRASGNVTSITDNGTGDYTVNFTTAMPDADYTLVGTSSIADNVASATDTYVHPRRAGAIYSTTQIRIQTEYNNSGASTLFDSGIVGVAIFR